MFKKIRLSEIESESDFMQNSDCLYQGHQNMDVHLISLTTFLAPEIKIKFDEANI